MKTLYLDCSMGAAGDMLTAALLELLPNPEDILAELNQIGLTGVQFTKEPSVKCGIVGTHVCVQVHGVEEDEHLHAHSHHEHHHAHSSLPEIEHRISHLRITDQVKTHILAVYRLLADAESQVHGVPMDQIHFHEVGTMDALADITAVCMLMDRLQPDCVVASPVHVGSGQVRCAHGILPVPAPATARLLCDIPIYGGEIKGELCTPTGAALLKHFVSEFGAMPAMTPLSFGYGMGKKDFPAANCVRAVWGTTAKQNGDILELCCNLDDMTPEEIGFACELLLERGALDVYTVPIGMKKSRPATMLCVLCKQETKDDLLALLFQHTSTLGVREQTLRRYVLTRRSEERETPYGILRCKHAEGYGIRRNKYEYEDLAKVAKAHQLSIAELLKKLP